jgi:hypothetical protein
LNEKSIRQGYEQFKAEKSAKALWIGWFSMVNSLVTC